MRVPHALLRDVITIEDYEGSGAMGPTYGDERSARASVQSTGRLVVDAQGRVVSTVDRVVIRPEAGPVAVESRVTFAGQRYRVIEAYAVPDTRRPSQYELQLARMA